MALQRDGFRHPISAIQDKCSAILAGAAIWLHCCVRQSYSCDPPQRQVLRRATWQSPAARAAGNESPGRREPTGVSISGADLPSNQGGQEEATNTLVHLGALGGGQLTQEYAERRRCRRATIASCQQALGRVPRASRIEPYIRHGRSCAGLRNRGTMSPPERCRRPLARKRLRAIAALRYPPTP
jgi:hypothetical protein